MTTHSCSVCLNYAVSTCFTTLLFFIAAIPTSYSQVGEERETTHPWERVVIHQTKKADISDWLGEPISDDGFYSAVYVGDFGKFSVWFGNARDPDNLKCNWNISADTVKSYSVSLREPIGITELGFNIDEFERESIPDGPIVYFSKEKGVQIGSQVIDGVEMGTSISYSPPSQLFDEKCR